MPGFLPAARLRRTPPPLVPYPTPVRTMLTSHGGHVNLLNSTVLASTMQSLDFWCMAFLVPNQIRSGLNSDDQRANYWVSASYRQISGIARAGSVGSPTITTSAAHGLTTGDIVEIVGASVASANGLWRISVPMGSTTAFTLDGSSTAVGTYGAGGYVEKHADAVARRQGVVDGGVSNASATPIRTPAASTGTFRGIGQANDHYFRYARDVLDLDAGQYISGTAITTPYEEFDRGAYSGYPMGPLLRTSKYANGWEIVSSDENSGYLRLTLNRTPPADWGSAPPSAILMDHSNIHYVSDIEAEPIGGGGVDLAKVFTVTSVAGNTMTLDAPYHLVAGNGGSLIIKGGIVSTTANGDFLRVTSDVAHGLVEGDFVYITGHSDEAVSECVWRVTGTTSSVVFDLDAPSADGSGGVWYGTCVLMRDDRFDLPDLRRDDVRAVFLNDWSRHVGRAFDQHGARHLYIDENAALYKLSAVDQKPLFPSVAEGTTERTFARLEQQKRVARRYGRRVMANMTWNLTKDAMSVAHRCLLQQSIDGMANEGAGHIFLRSHYQMIGPDGLLENLEWLLARGFLYYYIPQAMLQTPTRSAVTSCASDGSAAPRLKFNCADPALFPTPAQTAQPSPHNLSGSLFGVYGHSISGRNGVHRQYKAAGNYVSTTEDPWDGGAAGSGGNIVSDHFGRIMKTTGLSAGAGGKVRVTTEFPHLVFPNGASPLPGPTQIYLFGYTSNGLSDGGLYTVSYASANPALAFDLEDTTFTDVDSAAGIAFDVHADTRYFAGLAMMVWRPGRLVYIYESSLNYVRDWKNWIQGTKPDGPYSITSFDGTATGGSTTTLINSGASFTDAVLGESLLLTSGPNIGKFSRIVARTATQLTVSPSFASAIANTNSYLVGKTDSGDPTKVLEIKRSFNGGTRTISVWPQKSATVAVGF